MLCLVSWLEFSGIPMLYCAPIWLPGNPENYCARQLFCLVHGPEHCGTKFNRRWLTTFSAGGRWFLAVR